MHLLALALSLLSTVSSAQIPWALNDASILMPLADPRAAAELLRADAATEGGGELLPRHLYARVAPLSRFEPAGGYYKDLRVVALRVDPCFPGGATPAAACRRQVRLVWQPVEDIRGNLRAIDASMHAFYDFTAADFAGLTSQLEKLRAGDDLRGHPLGVHPTLREQGLAGPFYQGLKKILLSGLIPARLTRVTFMRLEGMGNVWEFGGFDVVGGELRALAVPRVNAPLQRFVNTPVRPTYFAKSGIFPAPPPDDTSLSFLTQDSRKIRPVEDEASLYAAYFSATRIQNPRAFTAEQVDCVSCHVAQPAALWADRQFPWLMLKERGRSLAYASTDPRLDNSSAVAASTTNLRAFGYLGAEPALSDRVIHETAEATKALNALDTPSMPGTDD